VLPFLAAEANVFAGRRTAVGQFFRERQNPEVRIEAFCARGLSATSAHGHTARSRPGRMEGLIGGPVNIGRARHERRPYGDQIGTFVREVRGLPCRPTARIENRAATDLKFDTGTLLLPNEDIMLTAIWKLPPNVQEILQGIRICNESGATRQPSIKRRAAFSRILQAGRGAQIDELGLKGHSVGDAE